MDSEPETLHTQLPIMLWITEAASHKFGAATKDSLMQDGAKSASSDMFHLQEEMTSTVHSLLPDAMVVDEAIPVPDDLGMWGAPFDQPSGQQQSAQWVQVALPAL